jgi:hypothetical protein
MEKINESTTNNNPYVVVQVRPGEQILKTLVNEETTPLKERRQSERCCKIHQLYLTMLAVISFSICSSCIICLVDKSFVDVTQTKKIILIVTSVLSGATFLGSVTISLSRCSCCCKNRCINWLKSWVSDEPPCPSTGRGERHGRG